MKVGTRKGRPKHALFPTPLTLTRDPKHKRAGTPHTGHTLLPSMETGNHDPAKHGPCACPILAATTTSVRPDPRYAVAVIGRLLSFPDTPTRLAQARR